jgi:hypothetical protein
VIGRPVASVEITLPRCAVSDCCTSQRVAARSSHLLSQPTLNRVVIGRALQVCVCSHELQVFRGDSHRHQALGGDFV